MIPLLLNCFLLAAAALQLQLPELQLDGLLSPANQEARLQAALPLAWIHVPKCGTSFGNFMVHLPGVCPGIPPEAEITDAGHDQMVTSMERWRIHEPDGSCLTNIFHWGFHTGIKNAETWERHYKHHAMIMIRDPEQRLLSAYNFGAHSWPGPHKPADVIEFAEAVQGCTVRMLTRPGKKPEETCGGGIGGLPTASEVQLAIARMRSDFAFVGLTDQWALSMCLGHRMFGGACRLSDFVDTRITRGEKDVEVRVTPDLWNTTSLQGFRDPYDGALYAVGLEVFQDELTRYSASLESCQPCFDNAGVKVKL